jgi:hypothetical protein
LDAWEWRKIVAMLRLDLVYPFGHDGDAIAIEFSIGPHMPGAAGFALWRIGHDYFLWR